MNSVISYTRNLHPKRTRCSSVDPPGGKRWRAYGERFNPRSKRFRLVLEQEIKKDRRKRFSVLAAREMERESFFAQSLTLVPQSCSQTARKRLRDQFPNKLFRVNLIEEPFKSSELTNKIRTECFRSTSDLVLGLPPYLSLVALQNKKQKTNWTELYNYCIIHWRSSHASIVSISKLLLKTVIS